MLVALCLYALVVHFFSARAENTATPLGEPVLEAPTLHCLGAYWMIKGDDNKNAKIEMEYRKAGDPDWRRSMPMFRVEKGAPMGEMMDEGDAKAFGRKSLLEIPKDAWLFAGSIVNLVPETEYELKLSLSDPDGGKEERVLKCKTIGEPKAPENMRKIYVKADKLKKKGHAQDGSDENRAPGNGSESEPFKDIASAIKVAEPGDLVLIHGGIYPETLKITTSGEPGKPIIFRGIGDGAVVIDAQGKDDIPGARGIEAIGVHDVWFEKLSICYARYGFVGHESARIVIRRCHFYQIDEGIAVTGNKTGNVEGFFISDNVLEGCHYTWVDPEGPDGRRSFEHLHQWQSECRGIEITGRGHEICYNRLHRFKDTLDSFPSQRCEAIDFHNNDCSEAIDDGIEMDFSERNTRCFENRFTDVFSGISVQPVFGGPVYVFRNVVYGVWDHAFKLHNHPSGAIFFHNTIVRKGIPNVVETPASPHNCVFRNNLHVGIRGKYAAHFDPTMIDCDFDYDGFAGGPWQILLKWNGVFYNTLDDVKAKAPVYKHAVLVDLANVFESGLKVPDGNVVFDSSKVDLRLKAGTEAIDAGEVLPGFNDGFKGKAPDLGAYELGDELPQYGPRPEK
jgi:hypothetical protein